MTVLIKTPWEEIFPSGNKIISLNVFVKGGDFFFSDKQLELWFQKAIFYVDGIKFLIFSKSKFDLFLYF